MSNVFSCVGTLGADAEYKQVGINNTPLLTFRIANNLYNSQTKTNDVIWIRCSLFGARADGKIKDYLLKGQHVFVSGELKTNEFEGKNGKQFSLELNCNIVDLAGGGKRDNQQAAAASQPQQPPRQPQTYNATQTANGTYQPNTGNDNWVDPDIPF